MREYQFVFNVVCAGNGTPQIARVGENIDHSKQDLVFFDEFNTPLDQKNSVTIQVNLVK
jgi:hypothetical protein